MRESDQHKWKIILSSSSKSFKTSEHYLTNPLNLKPIDGQRRFDSLYPPGNIYHYLPVYDDENNLSVRVVRAENSDFQNIIVSGRMLEHHMPNYVQIVLDQVSLTAKIFASKF